ncbi:MAG TPA: hypothetical protein VM238_17745, partial [Phycisphaerae bacterium]|nr:hypothetical protein [Phycisphaerae bacterium]
MRISRAIRFGRLLVVCALTGVPAALPLFADTASADLVLVPPSGGVNRFDITVVALAWGTERHDTDTTTVTGNALSVLTFDLDPTTCEASVTGLEFTGGRIYISDPSFVLDYGFLLGSINASGSGISGTLDTPVPPGSVSGTTFPANEHEMTLEHGTFHASGTKVVGTLFEPMTIDLAAAPITAPAQGTGTLSVSSPAIAGRAGTYDVTVTLPVNFNERVLDNDPLFVDVAGTGTLKATGQFTYPLPDPPRPGWTGQASDRWDNRANWSSVLSPGPASTAVFDAAAPRQPQLHGSETVEGVEFRTAGWTLEGAFGLTIGSGGIASDGAGANTVRPAVTMAADSAWTVGTGNTLSVTGELDGGTRALTKAGPGTVLLAGARNLAALNLADGTARLTSGGGNVLVTQALSVGPTATLDLTGHALIVDYTGGASPFEAMADWVASGYDGGTWQGTGIRSSAAAGHSQGLTAVGIIDNSDTETGIGGLAEFAGETVSLESVLATYTWWGDANLDGILDSNDYDRVDTN